MLKFHEPFPFSFPFHFLSCRPSRSKLFLFIYTNTKNKEFLYAELQKKKSLIQTSFIRHCKVQPTKRDGHFLFTSHDSLVAHLLWAHCTTNCILGQHKPSKQSQFFFQHTLYSKKFSSAKIFVKSDHPAVRQEFIFVKHRSSLVALRSFGRRSVAYRLSSHSWIFLIPHV